MGGDETDKFLRSLAVSMEAVSQQAGPISTHSFTVLCDRMMPVFSHLGSVFHFAKTEMDSKTSSLKAVEGRCPDLPQVVAADQAAGTLTKKGSPARNLHRLMNTIMFIKVLFEKLLEGSGVSLKDAASAAYEAALAPIHNFMVKTAIRTGLMALPSRDAFMQAIGESEESARQSALAIIQHAQQVISKIEALYDGVSMPKSNFTMW